MTVSFHPFKSRKSIAIVSHLFAIAQGKKESVRLAQGRWEVCREWTLKRRHWPSSLCGRGYRLLYSRTRRINFNGREALPWFIRQDLPISSVSWAGFHNHICRSFGHWKPRGKSSSSFRFCWEIDCGLPIGCKRDIGITMIIVCGKFYST